MMLCTPEARLAAASSIEATAPAGIVACTMYA
jgi:hypothetical protein